MWLSKPVYEALPFCYVVLGVVLTVASFLFERWYWEEICAGVGITALVAGLVLLLKRRGYRTSRSRLDFDEF